MAAGESQPDQNASLGVGEELVDPRHDLGCLVLHEGSETMLGVAPPLLVVLEHPSCPPHLVDPADEISSVHVR